MLIENEFRKCVGFLCVESVENGETHWRPAGTAFLVVVPLSDEVGIGYVVTAQHVVNATRPYDGLYLRVNHKDGGHRQFRIDPDDWVLHPKADVAVSRATLSDEFDVEYLHLDKLATDEYVVEQRIGEGDEVFFSVLFGKHTGSEQIQPVVRFGNISLMPREPVPIKLDPASEPIDCDAYLVEARSWGGHSGSPAFIYYLPTREEGFLTLTTYGESGIRLLGLIHGHFPMEADVQVIGDAILGQATVDVNAGIAVVVPAQKIIDLLMETEELVNDREAAKKTKEQNRAKAVPDVASPQPQSESNLTRGEFEDALEKATQKTEEPTKRTDR